MSERDPRRETTQHLLPVGKRARTPATGEATPGYDVHPTYPLGAPVEVGFAALADRIADDRAVRLDGYVGVFWRSFRDHLDRELRVRGVRVRWLDVATALRPPAEIEDLVAPYLGGDDPLFGTRCPHALADLFDPDALAAFAPDPEVDLTVVYGCGAALCAWDAPRIYVDLPKNELQYRARAGAARNLGTPEAAKPPAAKAIYKRFYFVDWPILDRHKRELLPRVDWIVDGQRPGRPTFTRGDALRGALERMARSHFRVRPWFEPGAWGGQWIRERIAGLAEEVPNYAWSFELIAPENGLLFEHENVLLEVSFDCLMFQHAEAVLGDAWPRFGEAFPIRFDLLDTVRGGNLSLQCHPRLDYIREHFGEAFTQDESYYILDRESGARVYLGFHEDVDPEAFRAALERSRRDGVPVDVERFVQVHEAQRHDLFLIPSGTVHCAGEGTLVLEISATPYIFTFKLYDWLRLDLDGRPRPLNIERGFENLDFTQRGQRVRDELIVRPTVIEAGDDRRVEHLPTHRRHFYDVRRYTFVDEVGIETGGSCHVMNLVAGERVRLHTADGPEAVFHYAETFVVPAAAGRYRLVNEGDAPAVVVQAFVKPEIR